jgi:hypothetical protein
MALKAVSNKSRLIPKRAKELNIIYFLDSNRTNSFKISFTRLKWIALGLAVASLWAVFSAGFVTYQYSRNAEIERRLETSIARLFEYQARFEGVYEKAYPSETLSSPLNSGIAAVGTNSESGASGSTVQVPSSGVKPVAVSSAGQVNDSDNSPAIPGQDPKANRLELSAKNASLVAAEITTSVKIESLQLQFEQGGLAARFSLRNTDSSTKAEGILLGVAKFEAADGKISYVGSPSGVRPDSNGIALSPHEGFRFGIKFHKPKKLNFAPPAGVQGKFTEVKLFVSRTKRGDFDASFTVDERLQRQLLAHTQATSKPILSNSSAAAPEINVPPASPESASADQGLSDEDLTPSEDGGE